ncbi:methenyltetrahydromethanopterin cyclohydrolase [Methanocella sp. CWC-04]|uniref:Methenyltetrahydromethanopterin cyclohydrolase n=1 Tax=Methanooceanicella nereidis TaxID=2052831 RepID=A0AAP2W5N9_9EURY|nr:methenyltetrahydromethanopterin cyclohydrolase [Methanocella sp. CWC-04]MCD1295725.1 methenyltetrahydromethanopterin cyclohydrolase [Methanocella sp. CWC-04]
MISINDNVTRYIDEILDREEELNVKSYYLENQATVIDCGVNAVGSIGAGILYAMVSLGGFGKISMVPGIIDDYYLHFSQVYIDSPYLACLGSQKPAWKLKIEGYTGTAFGPARAISQKPKALYSAIDYTDDSETAIINIESQALPGEKEIDFIAKQCSTDPECVVALVAKPNSIAGSIVNSTRTVEWVLNRLYQLGYDTRNITSASSATPIAPVMSGEQESMGVSFDSIAYYGMAFLYAKCQDERFKDAVSASSKNYGKGFLSIMKESQGDYSKVDPAMFTTARLTVNGLEDGITKGYGKLNPSMLMTSYGLKNI